MVNVIVRTGENFNQVWESVSQRKIVPGGDINAGDPNRMRSGGTRPLHEVVALRGSQIQFPQMVDIPGMLGKRIMPQEVTVGLFGQVMKGYKITGHNSDKLLAVLASPSLANQPLNYVSRFDGEEFARRINQQTGKRIRIQTEAEWEAARDLLKGNLWTWTSTPYSSETCVLRHLGSGDRVNGSPGLRVNFIGLRLVEYLNNVC